MGTTYAYIRVSTREQNEERQRNAMLDYGVAERNIILDKQSGKDFQRPPHSKPTCSPISPALRKNSRSLYS